LKWLEKVPKSMLFKESADINLNVAYCLAQIAKKIFLKISGLDIPLDLFKFK